MPATVNRNIGKVQPLWRLIPTRMSELLVGLGEVDLVGIDDLGEGAPLEVVIRSRKPRPLCGGCGSPVWSKGERTVVLVDLPAFGRPVRLGHQNVEHPRICPFVASGPH